MIPDLLFPNRCLECNFIIPRTEIICAMCGEKIHFTHWEYNEEHRLKEQCRLLFPIENAYSLMYFEQKALTKKIIHELKYRDRETLGKTLARWVIERLNFDKGRPDLLMPVPIHRKKMKSRGYNQLELFTQILSKHFEIPYLPFLVKRTSDSKNQAKKNKINRLKTEYNFSFQEKIENQHVLLIDDVFTTGNTLSHLAWEVLKSGNNKVSVLTIAVDL